MIIDVGSMVRFRLERGKKGIVLEVDGDLLLIRHKDVDGDRTDWFERVLVEPFDPNHSPRVIRSGGGSFWGT